MLIFVENALCHPPPLPSGERIWAAFIPPPTEGKTEDFPPLFIHFLALQLTVAPVIEQIAPAHLRMVPDLDKSLLLVLQGFAITGFGQEQAHFFSLPPHRGVMGEDVKNDHVPGVRVKPFQSHDIVTGQLLRPGLLPGLRQHFPDSLNTIQNRSYRRFPCNESTHHQLNW